jgi:hypothetical protein
MGSYFILCVILRRWRFLPFSKEALSCVEFRESLFLRSLRPCLRLALSRLDAVTERQRRRQRGARAVAAAVVANRAGWLALAEKVGVAELAELAESAEWAGERRVLVELGELVVVAVRAACPRLRFAMVSITIATTLLTTESLVCAFLGTRNRVIRASLEQ